MSFLSKIFGIGHDEVVTPDILFGRFSDSYKDDAKYDAWDQSIQHYEEDDYIISFEKFFEYLSDSKQENVQFTSTESGIEFEILQGSKKINGYANEEQFWAEGKIAHVSENKIGFMRRLLDQNYNLKYGRYCIDKDGDISIVFDSLAIDASPYKLYYGLKEIALAADKQDDLLVEEFEALVPVNTGHIIELSDEEKAIKAAYVRDTIEKVLDYLNHGKLSPTQYPGALTYLLLNAVYKLDFLTRPEGFLMEAFERMHRTFFASDGLNNNQKNHNLIKEFRKILDRPDERILQELYRTVATFGIINPSGHERFRNIVDGELKNMTWYMENGYEDVAISIPGYIVGHALFYYSLPEPDKDLLLLYYQIMEQDYFNKLGFKLEFYDNTGNFRKGEVKDAIQVVVRSHRNKYPSLDPDYRLLDFSSMPRFARSYVIMMHKLDLTKVR